MLWVLVDIAIALAALAALVKGALTLWKHAKALTRQVGEASARVAAAQEPLATAQAAVPARRRVG